MYLCCWLSELGFSAESDQVCAWVVDLDGDSDSTLRWLWEQALGVVNGSPQRAAGAWFCWGTLGATAPPKDDKAGAFCTRCPGHWLRATSGADIPKPLAHLAPEWNGWCGPWRCGHADNIFLWHTFCLFQSEFTVGNQEKLYLGHFSFFLFFKFYLAMQESDPGPLNWEHRVSTTEQSEKSLSHFSSRRQFVIDGSHLRALIT